MESETEDLFREVRHAARQLRAVREALRRERERAWGLLDQADELHLAVHRLCESARRSIPSQAW